MVMVALATSSFLHGVLYAALPVFGKARVPARALYRKFKVKSVDNDDFAAMTEPPSIAHWLGTDQFGRDLLSRIIHGARTALIVGLSSAVVGGFAGLTNALKELGI